MSESRMKFLDEVEYSILYTTYDEFKQNRMKILIEYKKMNYKAKRIYKMYIYSNSILKAGQKDEIWEFLNGYGIDILGIDNC